MGKEKATGQATAKATRQATATATSRAKAAGTRPEATLRVEAREKADTAGAMVVRGAEASAALAVMEA
jgi:hypothetical protein